MKIKCMMPDAVDFDFTYGEVYEVKGTNTGRGGLKYYVIDDSGDRNYMKEEECKIVQSSVVEGPREWSGEGTPKVGQYLQVYVKSNIIESWAKAKVLAVDHNIIVVRYKYPDKGYKYSGFDIKDVRPIKSEKEKGIEEMLSNIHQDYSEESLATTHPREYVENAIQQLYDQGYIKGSRVEDDLKNPPKRK